MKSPRFPSSSSMAAHPSSGDVSKGADITPAPVSEILQLGEKVYPRSKAAQRLFAVAARREHPRVRQPQRFVGQRTNHNYLARRRMPAPPAAVSKAISDWDAKTVMPTTMSGPIGRNMSMNASCPKKMPK